MVERSLRPLTRQGVASAGSVLVQSSDWSRPHTISGSRTAMSMSHLLRPFTLLILALNLIGPAHAVRADEPSFERTEDVIYGRKSGTALTMDVFQPKSGRLGLGVVAVVSGGWFSSHEAVNPAAMAQWTDRGYTVFAVVHGSQPRYTIPDAVADLNRAVRFIRAHANDYQINPDKIGITGGSAGGHLSLMQGTAGDLGKPDAKDPIDRVSSRVQAVACFFPPTDFLNYGQPGQEAIGQGTLAGYPAPFDFHEFDPSKKKFEPITDPAQVHEIARRISPITHVSADDPPTLIIHGDADKLVPIQQAEAIVARFKAVNVPAQLIPKPGAVHGWPHMDQDVNTFIDFFDKTLKTQFNGADPLPR